MKLGLEKWHQIQKTMDELLKCPKCQCQDISLEKTGEKNAKCRRCGCQWEFDLEVDFWWE